MDAKAKEQKLRSLRDRVKAFMKDHPEALDLLFEFTDAPVREAAMVSTENLDLHAAGLLCNRIDYIGKKRIAHRSHQVPRCRDKVIYTERDAHAKANQVWAQGRGRMRVYSCPLCQRYHLTHTAHRDSDQQVA